MGDKLYVLGLISSLIILYIFFGSEIKCGSEPKIILNIPPFIKNSKIYIGKFHLHHWLLGIILIIICCILKLLKYNSGFLYFINGFSIMLVIHGLFYQDCFDFR